jgi:hypothetical protein
LFKKSLKDVSRIKTETGLNWIYSPQNGWKVILFQFNRETGSKVLHWVLVAMKHAGIILPSSLVQATKEFSQLHITAIYNALKPIKFQKSMNRKYIFRLQYYNCRCDETLDI